MFRTQRVISCAGHDSDVICVECAPEENPAGDIEGACDAVLASVEDRRVNGGTREVVKVKTLSLIEVLVGSLVER
jgi:hypothetical protein